MFSYRHGFHAGNHADVLKHLTLVAVLRHMVSKDTALTCVDTHAGAGLYRLDGDYARTSGEAERGVLRLGESAIAGAAPALDDYLSVVRSFNDGAADRPIQVYPGSPFIANALLRPSDALRLFELHPTDSRHLAANIRQLKAGRRIQVVRGDGFEQAPMLLPPVSRRGLVICDPSYEIKSDYARVAAFADLALKRFATAVLLIWHPILGRPEAHELPRRLKRIAQVARRPWLHATLTVRGGRARASAAEAAYHLNPDPGGLPGSGVWVINPPHPLQSQLAAALPMLQKHLSIDHHAQFELSSSAQK